MKPEEVYTNYILYIITEIMIYAINIHVHRAMRMDVEHSLSGLARLAHLGVEFAV